jgi:hypothetical protein
MDKKRCQRVDNKQKIVTLEEIQSIDEAIQP